jgi:hypothetical protein
MSSLLVFNRGVYRLEIDRDEKVISIITYRIVNIICKFYVTLYLVRAFKLLLVFLS